MEIIEDFWVKCKVGLLHRKILCVIMKMRFAKEDTYDTNYFICLSLDLACMEDHSIRTEINLGNRKDSLFRPISSGIVVGAGLYRTDVCRGSCFGSCGNFGTD
jgi:hypothetical protein